MMTLHCPCVTHCSSVSPLCNCCVYFYLKIFFTTKKKKQIRNLGKQSNEAIKLAKKQANKQAIQQINTTNKPNEQKQTNKKPNKLSSEQTKHTQKNPTQINKPTQSRTNCEEDRGNSEVRREKGPGESFIKMQINHSHSLTHSVN